MFGLKVVKRVVAVPSFEAEVKPVGEDLVYISPSQATPTVAQLKPRVFF